VPSLRIALCQLDLTVGDLDGNAERIIEALGVATDAGSDLAVFPELAVTGYPPEDLLLKPRFVADNRAALERIAAATRGCVAVVGFVEADRDLYNAAAVCVGGEVRGIYRKQELPNYAVFDEARYFTPGRGATELYGIGGVRVGVSICEDSWNPAGPIAQQAAAGAELVVNLNASPYAEGRPAERERMLATRAADASCALAYVNQVGGQDELVFDGGSQLLAASGEVVARAAQYAPEVLIADLELAPVFRKRLLDPRGRRSDQALPEVTLTSPREQDGEEIARSIPPALLDPDAEVYGALVAGTRAYVRKNGFTDVTLGLSGGIDSSLVAAIAADAVGPEHVHVVAMPSRYSSDHSVSDAEALAKNLGLDLRTIPIEPAHAALLDMLAPSLEGRDAGLTEENLQSRIRGVLLMALSNSYGWLVLTTGNKSETAVGYSTLYGDTAGAFAVIKDVFKTRVYTLCRWRNAQGDGEVIPESVLTKPPSAELRPDQRDDQSLPPYEVLDEMLRGYVEADLTGDDLIERGFDEKTVRRVVRLVDLAEFKRRQSPPGVRVSRRAFGKDRRLPITNRYSG
jgi:NAD+ synthase (glutamine-hydrolysing)